MAPDLHRRRMPARSAAVAATLALLLPGCAGRGSAENDPVTDTATRFLAAAASAPENGCSLLAPATLEEVEADGEKCADVLPDAAGSAPGSGEPQVDVYGRDAMVRWGDQVLFLARFDQGWRVTAAGCEPTGKDLPYDCEVEGP
ncbi:hypothetical protein ACOCJ5_09950 [Knoellia sp. CPCC 206450]|uniref:hypothetical protein n=1 Tax=Knoellia tibetensis TaxID=3404798 RepID=UPI003B434552